MNKPKTMRPVYQIAALLIFIGGLLLVRGSLSLHYYTPIGPGPGFLPFWLSLILTILAVLMFLWACFGRSPGEAPADLFPDAGGFARVGSIIAALTSAGLLLERAGFGPAMFVMNLFAMLVLIRGRIVLALVVALIGSFGVEYVFIHWLNVPLPATDFRAFCPKFLCGG